MKARLYRILTNTFLHTYRIRPREPQPAAAGDIQDWQLPRAATHPSSVIGAAEVAALERLPGCEVTRALLELPNTCASW